MRSPDLVPGEILRLLSLHGEVKLVVGDPARGEVAIGACSLAPYESCLYLFVARSGRVASMLLRTCKARVVAVQPPEGENPGYDIDLRGRALLGPPLNAHPLRLELMPWLPEGVGTGGFEVVHMWTEELEFKRGDSEFFGRTPAGRDLPRATTRWWSTAYGASWPLLILGLPLALTYIAWTDHPWRALPVALTWMVVPCWIAGPTLWYRSVAFSEWRRGRKAPEGAGMISEALLPPGRVFGASITAHILGLLAFLPLFFFSPDVPGIVFFSSFIWLTWPIALTRIFAGEGVKEG